MVSTVALLPVLQVAIAAALPPVHGPGVGHVEETLAPSGAQVAPQLPLVAAIEHPREGVPGMALKKDKYTYIERENLEVGLQVVLLVVVSMSVIERVEGALVG